MRKSANLFYRQPGHFSLIGKNTILRPEALAKVQTDGSFKNQPHILSRTAVILKTHDKLQYSLVNTYSNHKNSTESEWCSVLDGLQYSIKKKIYSIELENDNLGVMTSLIKKNKPNGYLVDYYYYIFDMVKNMEWVAMRWIPRELNKSDRLFRL
jgi:ribonuclease HI